MHDIQSPITVPAESRLHLTPAVVGLSLAVASLAVITLGPDDSAPQPQQVRIVQPVGYGSGV